jgi:hypothetical protein
LAQGSIVRHRVAEIGGEVTNVCPPGEDALAFNLESGDLSGGSCLLVSF